MLPNQNDVCAYGGKKTAYIGSSNNLRIRLLQHLSNSDKAKYPYFRYEVVESLQLPRDLEKKLGEEY